MPTTIYTDFTAAARGIGNRTDAAGAGVSDISAEEDRLAQALVTEGAITTNAYLVQADAAMNITVGSGSAKADLYAVAGGVAGQGVYLARLDQTPVTITVPAADASQTRTDEVWLVIADAAYDGGSVSLPRLSLRKGDVGGAPPGPDGTWTASALLATITVPAGATQITAGNITDERVTASMTLVPPDPSHGDLTGLADDDHPQYVKAAGDTITGDLRMDDSKLTFADSASTNAYWIDNTGGDLRFVQDVGDNGTFNDAPISLTADGIAQVNFSTDVEVNDRAIASHGYANGRLLHMTAFINKNFLVQIGSPFDAYAVDLATTDYEGGPLYLQANMHVQKILPGDFSLKITADGATVPGTLIDNLPIRVDSPDIANWGFSIDDVSVTPTTVLALEISLGNNDLELYDGAFALWEARDVTFIP